MKTLLTRLLLAAMAFVSAPASAQDWGNFAMISSTLGVNGNRICIGEGLRASDIGCPTYAPTVRNNGNIGVSNTNPIAKLDVWGSISASEAIQVGQSNYACINQISGSIRFNTTSNTLQVCTNTGWVSLASGTTSGGGGALSTLSDVQLTNLAGRDYLRFDQPSGKWVNISESTVMSTTTMVPGWPDAIVCNVTNPNRGITIFHAFYLPFSDGLAYYRNVDPNTIWDVMFTSSKTFSGYGNITTSNCNKSIAQLYADGQAFNFIGNANTSGSTALGDRITSGTLAMVANSNTAYISLSTNGTDWGYLNAAQSYLPRLNAANVSSTYVSASVIQVSGSTLTCNASLAGALRYNGTSNTVQVCASNVWTSLSSGTSAGVAALASLTDVSLTNLAGRDYLRYDTTTSKWFNISESTVMSTTTVHSGWPDALLCAGGGSPYTLYYRSRDAGTYAAYVDAGDPSNRYVRFNTSTGAYSASSNIDASCQASISSLYASGRAFNFIGGGASSSALGDRITSGTLAMVANSTTAYISLSTNGIDWGYLNATQSYLPRLNAANVSSTYVSASVVQVSGSTLSCNASLAGALRYNNTSNTVQVCASNVWTSLASGTSAGVAALASLTDVSLTNLAGRDYLRYDTATSKWLNISESTVMSTTTMVAGWPDALVCNVTNPNNGPMVFYLIHAPYTGDGLYRYRAADATNYIDVKFNANGTFNAYEYIAASNCGTSIAANYAAGRAFNFIGGGASSNALGDRITSGTLAMAANSSTAYISLSTNGTDWGYLNATQSYLPRLNAANVSSTYVSASVVQVSGSSLTCSTATKGAMRYSNTSNTLEYCNSTTWVSAGPSSTAVPAFSVNKGGTGQSIPGSTATKLTWPVEVFDTNNNFDNVTNNRFTPTIPGRYYVHLQVNCPVNGYCLSMIYKNGASIAEGRFNGSDSGANSSIIVDMNGSTDYIEGYAWTQGGSVNAGANQTYMFGYLLNTGGAGGGTATPAGTTADLQFNTSGALDADSGAFTYLKASGSVSSTRVSSTLISATLVQLASPSGAIGCTASTLNSIRANPTTGAIQVCVSR